jgi:tRNA A-37 threonylcarbamoyl transferase component Bud32
LDVASFSLATATKDRLMAGLFMQPNCAELLFRRGLRNFGDFFRVASDEVSGGHSERNVAHVEIDGLSGFLKREYFIHLKDCFHSWWAGFGFVSKSEREWLVLRALRAREVPCPEPLAMGAQAGKAFLFVRALPDAQDLRSFLGQQRMSPQDRGWLANLLGKTISDLHTAGFTHPDLYAKHVFVTHAGQSFAFIDFQRSRKWTRVSWRRRCRDLAALNASLGDDVVTNRERLHVLFAYLRHVHHAATGHDAVPMPRHTWRKLVRTSLRMIDRRTRHLLGRRRVRRMRECGSGPLIIDYWRVAVRGLDEVGAVPVEHSPPRLRGTE